MRLFAILLIAAVVALPAYSSAEGGPSVDGDPVVAEADQPEERLTDQRRRMREDFAAIGIDEQLGAEIDLSIALVDHNGMPVTLADFAAGDRPVVLTFVYHSCPMLCSMVLDGLTQTMRETRFEVGKDYQLIAVSLDPLDTPEVAAAARDRYVRALGDEVDGDGFVFLTGPQESITKLTAATGFRYQWLEDQQEFAHNPALILLTPTGVISRYLYGLQFPSVVFRRSLVEAGEGTVGSAMDQVLLYCFMYDPDRGGYVLHATNAMRAGGLLTVVLLITSLLIFWRREGHANVGRRRFAGSWTNYEDALSMTTKP